MQMATVNTILSAKGSHVWSVSSDATVYDVLVLMAAKNIGAVAVVDDNHLVGIVSERDYARKITLLNKNSRDTRVSDIMTRRVRYVAPSTSLQECLQLMTEHRFRHLPVMDGEDLVGFLSIGDVVKAVIEDQKVLINHLESYITG
jgi:CBS domain-containing protein